MKKIIYVTLAATAIFLSCKKDDNAPAPGTSTSNTIIAKKKVTRSDLYTENGYVSGTITSKTTNGEGFVRQFSHQLDLKTPTYYINSNGHYEINIGKMDKSGSITNTDKNTALRFVLNKNLVDVQNLLELHTSMYVDSTAQYITKFNIDQTASSKSMKVFNVVFDMNEGTFSADYSITVDGAYTSSGKTATITGKINTTLANIRFRTGS